MYIAIDVILVATPLYCVWRGYRGGIIRGVCGALALIVAIFGANIVASAYSGEVADMLEPFVGGIVDGALATVTSGGGESDGADAGGEGTLRGEAADALIPDGTNSPEMRQASYAALRELGLPEAAASLLSEKISDGVFGAGAALEDIITEKLCSALAYIAVFAIVFLLVSIAFAVLGNILNLVFKLPGLELIDSLIGMVFGLFKGVVIVYAIAAVVRYVGLLAPSIIEETRVLKYLINTNPLADILGI
ncbi:MAG: CvpA family protein [Oscillospiraceae bacterium]|nr:CvpA family protein [Oscillospiraceae bacterium]